jgi:hypothetical protein
MRNIVQEVEKLERKPEFGKALDKLLTIWNGAGGSVWGKAKAIFYFLKDSYSLGIFWKIIKLIHKEDYLCNQTRRLYTFCACYVVECHQHSLGLKFNSLPVYLNS